MTAYTAYTAIDNLYYLIVSSLQEQAVCSSQPSLINIPSIVQFHDCLIAFGIWDLIIKYAQNGPDNQEWSVYVMK